MSMWMNIRNMFSRGEPSPVAVFKAAMRHDRSINVSFIDRERLPGNVSCKMDGMGKDRLFLKLGHPLSADMFSREKCNLYLKMPMEVLRSELGIRRDLTQNGFLSKSRILDCDCDNQGMSHHLCISMPGEYTRRELRRHERYRIFSGMIAEASLWILADEGNPASRSPDFSYHQGYLCPLRLVNISAGGAKVVLDKMDFLDEFAKIETSRLLLRLSLPVDKDEPLDTWLICRCVSSKYSINLRRFTVRLQFLTPGGLPVDSLAQGIGGASGAAEDGVGAIKNWLSQQSSNPQ